MRLRLPIVAIVLFLLILVLPFFVSQVESSTNTYYPSNYNLLGSTQHVSGSVGNLQSDDGNYMTFGSYSNYDFRFGESLGESSWNTNTEYQDKVVLTFTPPTSADYIVIATAEVQGNCISPPDVKARLYIGTSTCQELIYRIKDTTDWYPFCALKRVSLPASPQTLKIQYAISETTATAKIRNARLYAFSLSGEYAESEAESTSTSTSWQDKVALTVTPSTSGDYLIIATANLGGSSTYSSTLVQLIQDGSIVHAGPIKEPSTSGARYTFGVMRKITLSAAPHTFKIQYRTESAGRTAYIGYAHVVAIRIDQFSNTYYAENEGESGPAVANTWYDKVTNTYIAQAADHLIIGSILYKSGSASYAVGLNLLQGGTAAQEPLVEHKDTTDYEACFMMTKASLSAGSVTDKIKYKGESTSARVKNARLISLQLPVQHTVEVEFTGSSNTDDWTQLAWTVDSAWTTPSVPVTLQLYDYNLGQYPTSGDGYISYTSSSTSNTDETKSQTITTNPTHFRDGSGNWKIKVKGIKPTTTQFDLKADLIKFEVTYTPPIVQYYLTVKTDPEGIVSISGQGWYNNCTYVDLTAPLFVPGEAGVGGERYRFANWTVDSGFVSGNPISVYMDANHTAVAHYVKQYKLIISTNFGTTSPSIGSYWYDKGSVVSISATAPSVVDGEQYVWLGWTGTGTISYTGANNPASVTMNSPITETATWKHSYRLTMATNFGTTSPSVGTSWYEAGTVVYIQAFAPSVVAGEQYVWNGWTGTGTISYTGTANPSSVTMNSPISQTASWTHQFLLTIKTSGLPSAYPTNIYLAGSPVGTASDSSSYTKWFDAGTPTGTIGVDGTISGAAGTRYVFVKWVEDSSTSNPRASETMNSPKTFTAEYKTQYQITVTASPGGALGGTFKVTYTSCGTVYTNVQKTTSWTEWVDAGTAVTVSEPQDTITITSDSRYKFDYYNPSNSLTMDTTKTITLVYKTQYLVSFTQTGSGVAPTVTYTADIDPTETVPFGVWVKSGSQITYTYQDIVSGGAGIRYVLTGTTPASPQTVNSPLTITGNYKTQYYLTVNTNPAEVLTLNPSAVSGEGWYDSGATATVDAVQNVVKVAGQSRYDFRSWTGATPTGTGNQATVLMDNPKTATANYQLQYYLDVKSPYGTPGGQGWFDSGATPYATLDTGIVDHGNGTRRIFTSWGGDASGTNYAQSNAITMNGPKTAVANWKTQYLLTVVTDPSGLTPSPTRNPAGEAGSSNTWWYDSPTSVTLTAQTVTGYSFSYWDVDGSSKGSGTNPISVTMNTVHTATAHYIVPPLSVTINPLSATIYLDQTVGFTSSPSGGTAPYSYQWYLNGSPVSSSATWTFVPSVTGTYHVYLNVTDSKGKTAQSEIAHIVVKERGGPVGGYSISLTRTSLNVQLASYLAVVALFAIALSLTKRKRK